MLMLNKFLPGGGSWKEILLLGDAVRPLRRRPPATARHANRRHNAGGEPSFACLRESPKSNISSPDPLQPYIARNRSDNGGYCHPEEQSDEGSSLPNKILRFAQDDNFNHDCPITIAKMVWILA